MIIKPSQSLFALAFASALAATSLTGMAHAEDAPSEMTLKYGIGTDINLGIALGIGLNLDMKFGDSEIQAGPIFYYNRWTWEGVDGSASNYYEEQANTMVIGGLINSTLPSNDPTLSILYGYGVAFVRYNYQQTSPDDSSIGPLINGEYVQDDTYTGVGVVTNFGINKRFSDTLELQFEMPVIITPTSFAPAFTVSLLRQL